MFQYYTATIFIILLAMLSLQFCIARSNTLSAKRKTLFHLLLTAVIIAAFCEWFAIMLENHYTSRVLTTIIKAIELSVTPSISFLFAWVLEAKWIRTGIVYISVHAVIEFLSGIFGFIYYVDGNNQYHHGQFYDIYITAYVISMIFVIYIIMHNIKKYQYGGKIFFFLIVIIMLTGVVIQMINSNIKTVYIAMGFTISLLYVFTLEMIQQTDELTSLLNRRGYENTLISMSKECMVIFIDVDGFKGVNDNYGHAFGDKALMDIGKAIKEQYSKYGKCFRYGGDEYCILLMENRENVEQINSSFFKAMAKLREQDSRMPMVSVGYASFDPKNQSIQDVIEEADQMMYKYKGTKRTEQSMSK